MLSHHRRKPPLLPRGRNTPAGIRVEEGLQGGEELIVNPSDGLQTGARVTVRGAK